MARITVRLRDLLAWPTGLAYRAVSIGLRTDGAFRALILHDVPPRLLPAFDRLVGWLVTRHGVIAPEEALQRLQVPPHPGAAKGTPFLLTFDDGYASNLTVAREVLARHGVRGVFFVCPGLIELQGSGKGAEVVERIFPGQPAYALNPAGLRLMGWEDLRSLSALGHTVGAHGMTHRRLRGLAPADLKAELVAPAELLEQRLGAPIRWFAYPFGDIGSIDAQALEVIAQRYAVCCSGVRGLNRPGGRALGVLRESLDLDRSSAYQRLEAAGGLDWQYRRARASLTSMLRAAGAVTTQR